MPCSISGVMARGALAPGAAARPAGGGASTLASGREPGAGIGMLGSGVVFRARPEPIAMPKARRAMAAALSAAG